MVERPTLYSVAFLFFQPRSEMFWRLVPGCGRVEPHHGAVEPEDLIAQLCEASGWGTFGRLHHGHHGVGVSQALSEPPLAEVRGGPALAQLEGEKGTWGLVRIEGIAGGQFSPTVRMGDFAI